MLKELAPCWAVIQTQELDSKSQIFDHLSSGRSWAPPHATLLDRQAAFAPLFGLCLVW